jgi:hypothetical protein
MYLLGAEPAAIDSIGTPAEVGILTGKPDDLEAGGASSNKESI